MPENSILGELYSAITKGSELPHIPHSDVFYAQRAYYESTGNWVSLDHMERAMYVEGMLERSQVLDPDRERTFDGKYTY